MPYVKPTKEETVRDLITRLAAFDPNAKVRFHLDGPETAQTVSACVDGPRGEEFNRFREGALEQLFDEVSR